MRSSLVLIFLLFPAGGFAGVNGVDIQKTLNKRLLYNITFGSFEDIKMSVFNGASVDAYDIRRNSALHHAVELKLNSFIVVEFFLVRRAYPNPINEFGNMPFHGAAHSNEDPRVHRILLDHGADIHAKGELDDQPLHSAARANKNPEVFKVLFEYGADARAKNQRGDTPLEVAEYSNNLVAINTLKQRLCHLSFE